MARRKVEARREEILRATVDEVTERGSVSYTHLTLPTN